MVSGSLTDCRSVWPWIHCRAVGCSPEASQRQTKHCQLVSVSASIRTTSAIVSNLPPCSLEYWDLVFVAGFEPIWRRSVAPSFLCDSFLSLKRYWQRSHSHSHLIKGTKPTIKRQVLGGYLSILEGRRKSFEEACREVFHRRGHIRRHVHVHQYTVSPVFHSDRDRNLCMHGMQYVWNFLARATGALHDRYHRVVHIT